MEISKTELAVPDIHRLSEQNSNKNKIDSQIQHHSLFEDPKIFETETTAWNWSIPRGIKKGAASVTN